MYTSLKVAIVAPFPIRKLYPSYCTFTKSGQEHPASWIVNIVYALSKRKDIELHLVTIKSHIAESKHFFVDNVHFHVLSGTRNTIQPFTFYELDRRILIDQLQKIGPDVVESFGTEGPFSYAGVTSGYPCVIKVQGIIARNFREIGFQPMNYLWWRYLFTKHTENKTFRLCTDAIVDNNYMAEYVQQVNPHIRNHYIPNLIATQFFQIKQNWEEERKNIVFIGSIRKEKGIFDLVEAFAQLHNSGTKANLRIIGSGSTQVSNDIRNIVIQQGIAESVQMLGQLNHQQIANELQKAAFLVQPSWADSSPNTVYEAMVAGLGVIATKVGGLPHMIDNGETGYLVNPRDPNTLAETMKILFRSNSEQQRIGTNAIKKMRTRFEENKIINDIINVYQNLIARSNKTDIIY